MATDNIDKELERILLKVEIDNMESQILYHIRFYIKARPATYDKNKIKKWVNDMRSFSEQFCDNKIDAKQYLKWLENTDKEVEDIIVAWEQCL